MAMNDRELLEFIAAQVGIITADVSELKTDVSELKTDVSGLKTDVSGLKEGQSNLEDELKSLKKVVIDMEENHGKKITLLLDGYKQNANKLDRIEKEVSKHEEIILRRIK